MQDISSKSQSHCCLRSEAAAKIRLNRLVSECTVQILFTALIFPQPKRQLSDRNPTIFFCRKSKCNKNKNKKLEIFQTIFFFLFLFHLLTPTDCAKFFKEKEYRQEGAEGEGRIVLLESNRRELSWASISRTLYLKTIWSFWYEHREFCTNPTLNFFENKFVSRN